MGGFLRRNELNAFVSQSAQVKRLVNTARDEVECRPAFHLDGGARVMRQDERWNVRVGTNHWCKSV
jgi:hypothetical protein